MTETQELLNCAGGLEFVSKMEKPLNENEAASLLKLYPLEDIKKQLRKMDDWKGIHKRRSTYLTCLDWFERDIKKGYYKRPDRKDDLRVAEAAERRFFDKHPVGSEFTSRTGRRWLVESRIYLRCLDDDSVLPVQTMLTHNRPP